MCSSILSPSAHAERGEGKNQNRQLVRERSCSKLNPLPRRSFEFGLQFCYPGLQGRDDCFNLSPCVAWGNIFRAIPIVGDNIDLKKALHDATNFGLGKLWKQVWPVACVQDASVAEDLQTRALEIIHQEQANTAVGCEITSGKQLTVAPVVGKCQLGGTEDPKEPGRTTAMLDIGPSSLRDCGHVEAIASLDKLNLIIGEGIIFGLWADGRRSAKVVLLRLSH